MLTRIVAVGGAVALLLAVAVAVAIARAGSPVEAAVVLLNSTLGRPVSSDPTDIPFVVDTGDSGATVANRLAARSLIRSALAFRLVVRLEGLGSRLQAGSYELRPTMSTTQIAATFSEGQMVGGFLTIPEGWRIGQVADALDRSDVDTRADFVSYVEHPPASTTWPVPAGHSLEGFLFPDSYRFDRNTPVSTVVRQMIENFKRHVTPELHRDAQALGLSEYQWVTLASIVEREAVIPAERPVIASVYFNRLKGGMKLEADPTIQYVLADDATPAASAYWKRTLTFADLARSSPYNTYEVTGLPPGPICSPGLDSLIAAARPATTDYLYFVAKPDGSHAFAHSYAQQQQNVAKYQS
jgi:UPF0755 protein